MSKTNNKISNDDLTAAKAAAEQTQIVGIKRNYNSNPGQTLKVLSAVITGMTDNVLFPDMTPKLEDLVTAREDLMTALDYSKSSRNHMGKYNTAVAKTAAVDLLDICAAYVLEKSNNNYLMASTSGFTMKKTGRNNTRPKPEQAIILGIIKSTMPNEIIFKLNSLGSGVSYFLEMSITTEDNWRLVNSFRNSKSIKATGIEPGVKYFFRITGQTTGGYGSPSPVVAWIGQLY